MLTASFKTTRTKIIGTLCIILAVIIALILFFGAKDAGEAAESVSRRVKDNDERISYLASKGLKTALEPSAVDEVVLPKEMDDVLSEYNKIQLESGFDLSPYLGKTVKRYVYPIEGREEVFATLYVYEDKIIAADVASHKDGWQRAIDGKGNMG